MQYIEEVMVNQRKEEIMAAAPGNVSSLSAIGKDVRIILCKAFSTSERVKISYCAMRV